MTNRELEKAIALNSSLTANVRQVCVLLKVKRDKNPEVFDEFKSKLDTSLDGYDIAEAAIENVLHSACEDCGVSVDDIQNRDRAKVVCYDGGTIVIYQFFDL